jgi:hypothetical protein
MMRGDGMKHEYEYLDGPVPMAETHDRIVGRNCRIG